ncbi:MAG: thioredoxin domain-containing protein [bacterium]
MNKNQIIFLTLAVVVLFGGLYGVYKLLGAGPDEALIASIKTERPKERTLWNGEGAHTLTVFSDFQCPTCKVFHEYLTSFEATSSPTFPVTKKVAFVFRYFPLYQIHEHAFSLAYAAEAAARQGKFEDIAKRFFADQVELESIKDLDSYLLIVAKDLKLDTNKFIADMKDGSLQGLIQNDLSIGEKLGINSTPTFYLDGEKLDSMTAQNLSQLLQKLN